MVIGPRVRLLPEECSAGVSPTNEAMLAPVKRVQSPISTARANPVRVLIPRRQPSLVTVGVNGEAAAIASIAASSRSRRALTATTAW